MSEPEAVEIESKPKPKPKRPPRKRGLSRAAALMGARVAAGIVGLGVAAAAIAGAGLLPLPTLRAEPPSVNVEPEPTAQEIVCPGGLLRLGDEIGQNASSATSIGQPIVAVGSSVGEPSTESIEGAAKNAESAPATVSATPSNGEAPLVAASQSEVADRADLRGLATAACSPATTDAWLVGGATTVGRITLVSLANPSDVAASVDLRVWGERGPIDAVGLTGISVQPRSQRVIPLAGFAPDTVSPVVRVSSDGGRIVASLQQTVVRGLEPGGVDIVGAAAGASRNHVIPGIVVSNGEEIEQLIGSPGYLDLGAVIRVLVSGSSATEVTVTVRPENGSIEGETFSLEVEGGVVTELPIEELADGSYTVEVSARVPLVAAVRFATIAAKPGPDDSTANDFAWAATAPALPDEALFATAEAPAPQLHIANATDAAATVTITAQGGASSTLTVPAGTSIATPLESSTTYALSGAEGLRASVSNLDEGRVSAFAVQAPAEASSPLRVYPR